MKARHLLLLVALTSTFVGCEPPAPGALSAEGFAHKDYDLSIAKLPDGTFLGKDWKLDNYHWTKPRFDEDGPERFEPKSSGYYMTTYGLDKDGDGTVDRTEEDYTYNLRFKNARHDGIVFVRTIPLSMDERKKKLSVLLDRYAKAVSAKDYTIRAVDDGIAIEETDLSAKVVSRQFGKVGGRATAFARLEIKNLHQPDGAPRQLSLAVAHTPFKYRVSEDQKFLLFPVLLVVGYENSSEEYPGSFDDYFDLLERISIAGVSTFEAPQAIDDLKLTK